MRSSISLQYHARCTVDFKTNCLQQSQTVQTKRCLLASQAPGRLPSWVGSELENCQASIKCRCANTNLSALPCKELSGTSNRHREGAIFHQLLQKALLCAHTCLQAATNGFLPLWQTNPNCISKLSTLQQDPEANSLLWPFFLG